MNKFGSVEEHNSFDAIADEIEQQLDELLELGHDKTHRNINRRQKQIQVASQTRRVMTKAVDF